MTTITIRSIDERASENWPAVEAIAIEQLFGRYNYPYLRFGSPNDHDGDIALFYGENGSGKTTLLRLIYACLSPAPKEGLRTTISKIPFRTFSVYLRDGTLINVEKLDDLIGSFSFTISGPREYVSFHVKADDSGAITKNRNPEIDGLEDALRQLKLDLLFLHDTRRIQSTYNAIQAPNSWPTSRKRIISSLHKYIAIDDDYITISEDEMSDTILPLKLVISSTYDWIRRQAARQGSTGDSDASRVYLQVIKSLSYADGLNTKKDTSREDIIRNLTRLQHQTETYINYGLLSEYPFENLKEIITLTSDARLAEISTVLLPYLNSISTRIEALDETHKIISTFEREINSYLRDKKISINVIDGIHFSDERGEIDVDSLSSGERQLVFLFCAALLSRVGSSLFIIDEPELSLNVKWQRKLVSSLAHLVKGGQTQFIMATHSIEILSKHQNSVVELISRVHTPQDN